MTPTNTDRAIRAHTALMSGRYVAGFGSDLAHQAVKNLLGDLRHFCDRADVDFGAADRAAYTRYCEQRLAEAGGSVIAPATGDSSQPPVVVVVRHPDHANDVDAFPGDGLPIVLNVDLGSAFDGVADDAQQYAEWRASMDASYRDSGLGRDHPAYAVFLTAIESADPAGR